MLLVKTLVTAAVAGLAAGLTCTPAHAALQSADPIRITESRLDFGAGNFGLGVPGNSGVLGWDLTGAVVTPILSGTLYINNSSSTCARMRLETYDSSHTMIGYQNGGTVCSPDNTLNTWTVYFAAPGDPATTHAHAVLQEQNPNNSYSEIGTATASY